MAKKKRTTLDAILSQPPSDPATSQPPEAKPAGKRPHVKQQTLYLSLDVHKRLKLLALEEDKRQHDLLLEALDLLFADRGLPGTQTD